MIAECSLAIMGAGFAVILFFNKSLNRCKKIVVYQAETTGEGRTRKLDLRYNFVDTLHTP